MTVAKKDKTKNVGAKNYSRRDFLYGGGVVIAADVLSAASFDSSES